MTTLGCVVRIAAMCSLCACGSEPAADVDSSSDAGLDSSRDADIARDVPDDDVGADSTDLDVSGDDTPTTDGAQDADDADADLSSDADSTEWTPPDGFGDTGFGLSETPLCRPAASVPPASTILVNHMGVLVLSVSFEDPHELSISRHDGVDWSLALTAPVPTVDGWLGATSEPGGGIFLFSHSLQLSINEALDGTSASEVDAVVEDAFSVGDSLTYALIQQSPGLLFDDGTGWMPYPGDPFPLSPRDFRAVWADDERVFIGGRNGTVIEAVDGGWTVLDTGSAADVLSLWGNASGALWAGTEDGGLLVYDGGLWNALEWTPTVSGCSGDHDVEHLWGSGDEVYFAAGDVVGRATRDGVEVLGEWPGVPHEDGSCDGGLDVWSMTGDPDSGNVFFLAAEFSSNRGCEERVVYFDGTLFHWM